MTLSASSLNPAPTESLIQQTLAEQLRAAILDATLQPGERIVEATWGRRFGVAQASIREAVHILIAEGFVTKASGRSARVVHLTRQDVLHVYALRSAFEGLAARLAAEIKAPLEELRTALDTMRLSAREGRCPDLLDADLAYHLALCRISENPYLYEHAKRILLPFFGFVRIRVTTSGQGTSSWDKDLEAHQKIIDLIAEGEGEIADQYVRRAMARFATTAHDNWEKR